MAAARRAELMASIERTARHLTSNFATLMLQYIANINPEQFEEAVSVGSNGQITVDLTVLDEEYLELLERAGRLSVASAETRQ